MRRSRDDALPDRGSDRRLDGAQQKRSGDFRALQNVAGNPRFQRFQVHRYIGEFGHANIKLPL